MSFEEQKHVDVLFSLRFEIVKDRSFDMLTYTAPKFLARTTYEIRAPDYRQRYFQLAETLRWAQEQNEKKAPTCVALQSISTR